MYNNKFLINDVIFLEEPKLLLIASGIDKLEAQQENQKEDNSQGFFAKIGKIFKKDKENSSNSCKGKFFIYNIIHNSNGELMVVQIKCLDVISEIVKLDYENGRNIISLGLNNGQILLFRLYFKESQLHSNEIIEYIGTINYHSTPPLACVISNKEDYIYSFSKNELGFKICELNYQNLISDIDIFNKKKSKGIICVDATISQEYIYIQDEEGSICFIDIISDPLKPSQVSFFNKFLKRKVNAEGEKNKGKIIYIKNSYYLFIGDTDLDRKKEKNKYILNLFLILINTGDEPIQLIKIKEIYLFGFISITNIEINKQQDIIISLSNGSICIYNHLHNAPEYIIPYHYKYVPKFIWYEKQKSIISVSHDKSIKIYQIPFKWPSEFLRKNKDINKINIIKSVVKRTNDICNGLQSSNIRENDSDDMNEEYEEDDMESNEKKYKNFWDIGNLDNNKKIRNYSNKDNDDNNCNDLMMEFNNRLKKNDYDDSNYQKDYISVKYDKMFSIFSDDLDGWDEEEL